MLTKQRGKLCCSEGKVLFDTHPFRLEYDACRTELELFSPGLEANLKQHQFEKYKENYEKLKHEVTIKLQLLDDNQVGLSSLISTIFNTVFLQVKVMKNQLLLFHNAIAAYFSGNKQALDATMKAFHLKVLSNDDDHHSDRNSFLEQSPQ